MELLRTNLQLPSGSNNTLNTVEAVACDDVGASACLLCAGCVSDVRDMLTCARSDDDEASDSES